MRSPTPRRHIRVGHDRLAAGYDLPRHQHFEAYATLVLKGTYEQLAYAGRLKPEAGDVVIQPTFDCHANRMLSRGLELIRLPWRREPTLGGVYRGCRIDMIQAAAKRNITEAVALLEDEIAQRDPLPTGFDDWADLLARDLAADPKLRIAVWADCATLSRERVSRGFASVYGVAPTQFRSELKARTAWLRITETVDPLATIAAEIFSDQAHMTRAVKALSGATPTQWRRSHSFKTSYLYTTKLDA